MHGVSDKVSTLKNFCSKNKFSINNIGYVGNDINDLDIMKIVRLSFCPADAHSDILKISDIILKTNGGDGVIRELYDKITENL